MIVILAIFSALLFAIGATASIPERVSPPTLTVQRGSKLVVRGSNFRDGERVTVTAHTGARPRAVEARAVGGRFRVHLDVPGAGCGAPRFVRARGDQGSVAVVGMAKAGICVPPPQR